MALKQSELLQIWRHESTHSKQRTHCIHVHDNRVRRGSQIQRLACLQSINAMAKQRSDAGFSDVLLLVLAAVKNLNRLALQCRTFTTSLNRMLPETVSCNEIKINTNSFQEHDSEQPQMSNPHLRLTERMKWFDDGWWYVIIINY